VAVAPRVDVRGAALDERPRRIGREHRADEEVAHAVAVDVARVGERHSERPVLARGRGGRDRADQRALLPPAHLDPVHLRLRVVALERVVGDPVAVDVGESGRLELVAVVVLAQELLRLGTERNDEERGERQHERRLRHGRSPARVEPPALATAVRIAAPGARRNASTARNGTVTS
jgi:hypothetical protein